MSYPQDYQQRGYPIYGNPQQMNQAQYQHQHQQYQHHSPVVSSQPPPRNGTGTQYPPLSYLASGQTGFYQLPVPQYYTAPLQPSQQQYYQSQPSVSGYNTPAYRQQSVQYSQHQVYQQPYRTPQSQPNYQQPQRQAQPQSSSPQYAYQSLPAPAPYQSPQLSSHLPSSPDPLHGPSTVSRPHVSNPQHYQQPAMPPPKPQRRSSQHAQPSPAARSMVMQQVQPQQRVMKAVEIPAYEHDIAPSPKRRRSNEGHAVSVVNDGAVYARSSQPKKDKKKQKEFAIPAPIHAAPVVSSSPLTELNSSQLQSIPKTNVDYQSALLSTAEEYIEAAYSMSNSIVNAAGKSEQHEDYCALITTAMACLETVLNNFRPADPRKEARIRLRLATLLVDECDNDEDVDAMIGRGIAQCDFNRLPDLKYAMQHLSVRWTSRKYPVAALKTLDKLIHEVEVLKMEHWVYTFHFLRVSLGLQHGSQAEVLASAKHIGALNKMAEEQRHKSVSLVAATMEAIAHLRSHNLDAAENASQAIASARTHQLGPEIQAMPQIRGLLDCVDIACSLKAHKMDEAMAKVQRLQEVLDEERPEKRWAKDGSFAVRLGTCRNRELEQDTGGILNTDETGHAVLAMHWLTKGQLYTLSFALSVFTMITRNPQDPKIDTFMAEGRKMARSVPGPGLRALGNAVQQAEEHVALAAILEVYSAWSACSRFEWDKAREAVRSYCDLVKGRHPDAEVAEAMMYLSAVACQGLGDLTGALDIFSSGGLLFSADGKGSNYARDIRALASLNAIMILRTGNGQQLKQASSLMASLEHYCLAHPNKAMNAAFNIIRATSDRGIVETKQVLQHAVKASKEAHNHLLMSIIMNAMTSRFFGNAIVGEQAEKSAQAARTLAKQGRNRLWAAVADGVLAEIKDRCGKPEEAEMVRREGLVMLEGLPQPLLRTIASSEECGIVTKVEDPTAGSEMFPGS